MTIHDLTTARADREMPTPDLIHHDDYGHEMRTYALEYEMYGARWATTIIAYSMDDAEARVAAMRESLVFPILYFAYPTRIV